MSAFLTTKEVSELTGRKIKSKQIETLRGMGLAFFINAAGRPIVPISAVQGKDTAPEKKKWQMPD